MTYRINEIGGLAVAFSPTDQKSIQRELEQLDRHLFLDPEVETVGPGAPYVFMTVKHHIGSEYPPVLVLEWRDSNGPIPLSHAIVERVKRQEGGLDGLVQKIIAENKAKQDAVVKKVGDESYDVALDAKKATGKTSAVLPRSQALRMSRDRARARGKKV